MDWLPIKEGGLVVMGAAQSWPIMVFNLQLRRTARPPGAIFDTFADFSGKTWVVYLLRIICGTVIMVSYLQVSILQITFNKVLCKLGTYYHDLRLTLTIL